MSIKNIMEAYKQVSEPKQEVEAQLEEGTKVECPKCEGKGCDHCDDKGYHMEEACSRSKMKNEKLSSKEKMARGMYNEKKLDPVGQEDDDVDNDGDTDSSDKYLKNRRKKVTKAVKDGDKDPAEISKIESTENVKESLEDQLTAMFAQIAESIDLSEKKDEHTKGATDPEEIDSKESPKSKEFIDQHKKSDKKIEDNEEDGHDKTFKAGGKDMKQAPNRGNDNLSNGDKKPVKGK